MTLYQIIVESSRKGVTLQNPESGSMPAGHNGPYHDPETPVRNTGHWVMLFLKAHEISGDPHFLQAAGRGAEYLCSTEARPMGFTFYHRKNPLKDTCNGLIGQAWSIEALIAAGESLKREECLSLATEVFLQHPFQEEPGVWQRVAPDGMHLPVDETFNHQLWFAAAAAPLIHRSEEIHWQITRFMQRLPRNLRLYRSGLIVHPLLLPGWKKKAVEWKRSLKPSWRLALQKKAVGYHLFNMYAFAMLHRVFPDDPFWQSEEFRRALNYCRSESFRDQLMENPYGFPYNPPGFEIALTMEEFGIGTADKRRWWVEEQLRRCYNFRTGLMDRESEDPATQSARLYEAVRLQDLELPRLEPAGKKMGEQA